jgi:hypothetical protein
VAASAVKRGLLAALVVLMSACHPAARLPTTPSASAAVTRDGPRDQATPPSDRALFEILVRLAREPGARAELAPRVESVHEPMEGADPDDVVARGAPVRELVADPGQLIARYGPMVFLDRAAAADDDGADAEDGDDERVSCACDAQRLTCTVYQSGGTAEFRFVREGERVILREHHWEYP